MHKKRFIIKSGFVIAFFSSVTLDAHFADDGTVTIGGYPGLFDPNEEELAKAKSVIVTPPYAIVDTGELE